MEKLSKLMKDVSLHSLDKITQIGEDECFVVFYKDDTDKFDSNKQVDIAASVLQLDAILCYTKREMHRVVKMKTVETYT